MTWDVVYLPEAERDFADLTRTQQLLIRKAIEKVRQNPLPVLQADGQGGSRRRFRFHLPLQDAFRESFVRFRRDLQIPEVNR